MDAKKRVRLRTLFVVSASLVWLAPAPALADTRVDCDRGERIADALRHPDNKPLTINVRGTCTENVTISRDDVTLQGDPGATVNAADAGQAAIRIDAARRVGIQGLTVNGGSGGIVGTNGARFDVAGCTVQGSTRFGVISSYESTGTLDGSTVQNITGDGVVAANNSSLVITSAIVQNNTGTGVVGVRGGHVQIGQDRAGSLVVHPVTITGNSANGVSVTENSAGIIVGGSVSGNGRVGIFVGRGSSGQIGVGSGGLEAGVTIQSNAREGIAVEGANATILGSTIGGAGAGNGRAGIIVTNGASARIGIRTDSSAYVSNTISTNGRDGIAVSSGGAAFIGGNLIQNNGQDGTVAFRFGVTVSRATAVLVGGNTISGHPNSGVFAGSGGTARIGDPGFGLPITNTISDNGRSPLDGTTRGGIFAFQGGVIETRGAVIAENFGHGGQAFEDSIIEIREATVIRDNIRAAPGVTGDAGNGLAAGLRSTLRLRDVGTAVQDNDGDGVVLFNGAVVDFRGSTPPVSVTGNIGFGLRCAGGNVFYSGDVRGVTGNGGGNVDPLTGNIPGCLRF